MLLVAAADVIRAALSLFCEFCIVVVSVQSMSTRGWGIRRYDRHAVGGGDRLHHVEIAGLEILHQ